MSMISEIKELAETLDGTKKDIPLVQQLIQKLAGYTVQLMDEDNDKIIPIEEIQRQYNTPRQRLTPQERLQIIISEDAPSKICEDYEISLSTIRGIKGGSGGYQKFGGCKEYWNSYKNKFSEEIQLLEHVSKKKRDQPVKDKILDIITSSEAPSVLIKRYGYLMSTICQIKSGTSHYKTHGGDKQNWLNYKRLHLVEISRLSMAERKSVNAN
ncbi:hypothetical protein GCM10011332_32910 [Terasakiella brassicae]|uniref:Uncharacterized protein n=1 Tax=Terasakiella brassicae TaxID=1634917 RepID=A0A917C9L0_9PROT|nr:hypothetical protein [Terasakiella brassicae]GGF76358.1 hypothetical protein GCM10011332_32910 [Terasakiella brassicae]